MKSSISLLFISSCISLLFNSIYLNNQSKQIIKIPNLLRSLTVLINYKRNIHINQQQQQQIIAVRNRSRICLYEISYNGDQQDQAELIKVGYACALIISIGKIGGSQEDNDNEIKDGLKYISDFLRNLRQGRYYDITFHQQPALIKTCVEQIEEEGGNEEVDSQIENKQVLEYGDQYLKYYANWTIGEILNFFIDKNNPRPNWYFYEF